MVVVKEEVVLGVALEERVVGEKVEVEGMGRVVGTEKGAVANVVVARVKEAPGMEAELQKQSPG